MIPRTHRDGHRVRAACALACLLAFAVGTACSRLPAPAPPAPLAPSAPAPRALGALIAIGIAGDRVSKVDRPVVPDRVRDFLFRIRISGVVDALLLVSSAPNGTPEGTACWDTITGAQPIPPQLGLPFTEGRQTWALAVVDERGATLNPDGDLPRHTFHDELVSIFVSRPRGVLAPDASFTLFVVRPGGEVDRATTTLL